MARYLRRVRRRGDGGHTWRTFLANQREALVSFDFLTVPTVTFQLLYCFFVIEHKRRKILLRATFPETDPYRYIIFDCDTKFDGEVVTFLQLTGLEPKRTSIASPFGKLSARATGPRDPAQRSCGLSFRLQWQICVI